MSFKISWKIHLFCFILSYSFCLVMGDYVKNLFVNLLSGDKLLNITGDLSLDLIAFLFIIFIPITIVHEILQGVVYCLFWGKVKYGSRAYVIMHRKRQV